MDALSKDRKKKIRFMQFYIILVENTEIIEHELLKIKLSKSHQYYYRQTPTSVKKLLAS